MNLIFWFYVFASTVFIAGGSFYFYMGGQEVASALYFIGILAATIVFGLRWFPASGAALAPAKWSPVTNYCPDFLSLYVVDNEQVCVDTIGIANGISKWSDPTQRDEKYLFHLYLNQTGAARTKAVCDEAKTKGVTWEGVWNGYTCMGKEPPRPPSS